MSTDTETIEARDASALADVLRLYPSYRVVTDVGMSMISGWGAIEHCEVHHDLQAIELFFD
jgi:hypothetical protein